MSGHEEKHYMKRVAQYEETGWEEFHCPTCDRRWIMRWPPSYNRIILHEGDLQATHYYSSEGLDLTAQAHEGEATQEPPPPDPRTLKPFEDFLGSLGDNPTP